MIPTFDQLLRPLLSIAAEKKVTRPLRDLRLPFPPLIPANRFRLKLVAPALNWYPGWGSNPQDFRR
jgi:hypothetical protein